MKKILIIDYQMSNMFSIKNALIKLGYDCIVSNNRKYLTEADIAILPGVGAFPEAMSKLQKLDLIDPIKEFVNKSKKIIGICLGMQLLYEFSDEFKETKGLALIKGSVKKINETKKNLLVPHIGWNNVNLNNSNDFQEYDNKRFYFVHSYYCKNDNKDDILMQTDYLGLSFTSMVVKKNIYACQFHPEKSGAQGLSLLNDIILK